MEQRLGSELKKETNDYRTQSEKPLFYKRTTHNTDHHVKMSCFQY